MDFTSREKMLLEMITTLSQEISFLTKQKGIPHPTEGKVALEDRLSAIEEHYRERLPLNLQIDKTVETRRDKGLRRYLSDYDAESEEELLNQQFSALWDASLSRVPRYEVNVSLESFLDGIDCWVHCKDGVYRLQQYPNKELFVLLTLPANSSPHTRFMAILTGEGKVPEYYVRSMQTRSPWTPYKPQTRPERAVGIIDALTKLIAKRVVELDGVAV